MGLDGPDDNHNSIVKGPSSFLDILGSTASDDQSHSLGACALSEEIESVVSKLFFLKLSTPSKNTIGDSVGGGLDSSTSGLADSLQVILGHSASAEDVSVSKVLGGKITNREL